MKTIDEIIDDIEEGKQNKQKEFDDEVNRVVKQAIKYLTEAVLYGSIYVEYSPICSCEKKKVLKEASKILNKKGFKTKLSFNVIPWIKIYAEKYKPNIFKLLLTKLTKMKKLITILILILISFSINAQNELADVNIYTTLYIDASNKTAEQLYNKTMNYISNLPYSINEIDKNKQITLCLEVPFPDVTSMKEYIIKLNFRDNRIELNINLTVAERKKIEEFFNIHLIDYVYYLNK